MRELLDDIARQELAQRHGITLEQAGELLEAERQREARRSPAAVDADYRAVLAAAETHNAEVLATIMSEDR